MKRTLSFVGAARTVAVLPLPASPADAAFPGANGDLVFARFNREGPHDRFGVWVMPADGSGATRLTSGRFDFFPDWQPVGSVG